MSDTIREHIGDLPSIENQQDTDLFEIQGTGAGGPTSNRETRLQLKQNIAESGPVRTALDAAAAAAQDALNAANPVSASTALDGESIRRNAEGKLYAIGAVDYQSADGVRRSRMANAPADGGAVMEITNQSLGVKAGFKGNLGVPGYVITEMRILDILNWDANNTRILMARTAGGKNRFFLLKDKAIPGSVYDLDPNDELLSKGEILALISGSTGVYKGHVDTAFIEKYKITAVAVADGGAGYTVGNNLTLPGDIDAVIRVDAVDGAGAITAVSLQNPGRFPGGAITSGITDEFTGGNGTGATFDITAVVGTTLASIPNPTNYDRALALTDETSGYKRFYYTYDGIGLAWVQAEEDVGAGGVGDVDDLTIELVDGKLQIKDGGVGMGELADGAVSTVKLQDGAVSRVKLSGEVQAELARLEELDEKKDREYNIMSSSMADVVREHIAGDYLFTITGGTYTPPVTPFRLEWVDLVIRFEMDGVYLDYQGETIQAADDQEFIVPPDPVQAVSGTFQQVYPVVEEEAVEYLETHVSAAKVSVVIHDEYTFEGLNDKIAEAGKVDTVDGIAPGPDKNVHLSYIYETDAEFEAAKANIPVGAMVVKKWLYPALNQVQWDYSTDEKPVLNPDGTPRKWIDGKPIYRRVFEGTITNESNALAAVTLVSSGISAVLEVGGWLEMNTAVSARFPMGAAQINSAANGVKASTIYLNSAGQIQLLSMSEYIRTNAPYQIWVEYTKA